jgi:hypothetical protein
VRLGESAEFRPRKPLAVLAGASVRGRAPVVSAPCLKHAGGAPHATLAIPTPQRAWCARGDKTPENRAACCP